MARVCKRPFFYNGLLKFQFKVAQTNKLIVSCINSEDINTHFLIILNILYVELGVVIGSWGLLAFFNRILFNVSKCKELFWLLVLVSKDSSIFLFPISSQVNIYLLAIKSGKSILESLRENGKVLD